jgi:hypothetical protein
VEQVQVQVENQDKLAYGKKRGSSLPGTGHIDGGKGYQHYGYEGDSKFPRNGKLGVGSKHESPKVNFSCTREVNEKTGELKKKKK